MENLGMLIYWITRLDSLITFLSVIVIIGIIGSTIWAVSSFIVFAEVDEDSRKIWKKCKWIPAATALMLLVGILIPSSKEMALIYIAPKIANSEIVKELPADLKIIKDMGMEKIKDILKSEEKG